MLTAAQKLYAAEMGVDLGSSRRGEAVRYCTLCGSCLPRLRRRPDLIGLSITEQSRLACPQRRFHDLPAVRHVRGARSAKVHGPLRTAGATSCSSPEKLG